MNDKIKCLESRADQQVQILHDSCLDLFDEYDLDSSKMLFRFSDYQNTVKAIRASLVNAKKSDLGLIEVLRDKGIEAWIWYLCTTATILHKAGLIAHKEDLFQRDQVKCIDHTFFAIGQLTAIKYKWLTVPDIASHLKARDYILEVLGGDHSGEWK